MYVSEIKNEKCEITFPKINAPIPLIHLQYKELYVRLNFEYDEMYATYLYLPQDHRRYLAGRPSSAFGFNFHFLSKYGCCYKNSSLTFENFEMENRKQTGFTNFIDGDKKFRYIFIIY